MSELLQPGQVVETNSGQPCQVERCLGEGGQGEVYSARWQGGSFALKWYYAHTATDDQREGLENLLRESPPGPAFLWPLDLAFAQGVRGFGYLMPLREPRFKGLFDLMTNRIDPKFRELATVGLGLADSFFKLHGKGLCYRDISFGNVFFDPDTGDVRICDNDNVTANRSPRVTVLGTPDFMAPEIVRREAVPSYQTDLFSLAVLLFYIFHVQHPLKGRKLLSIHSWDGPAQEKLLGREPVFILDPFDKSNEAVDRTEDELGEAGANALKYWPIYPQALRDTFIQAFTMGLNDADQGRVTEGEWRRVLALLRDSIYYCACGTENFYDLKRVRDSVGGAADSCWSCGKPLRLPYRVRIGDGIVMLNHDTKLYAHHLENSISKNYDFTKVVGEVARHPTDAAVWGLKNCTGDRWAATLPDGSVKDIEPGRSVRLGNQIKVNFGKAEGEIRY
jgi:DNA-binding helix-hairpin-helix protein with protein kinase domain